MSHSKVALGDFTVISLHARRANVIKLIPKMSESVAVNAAYHPSQYDALPTVHAAGA